MKKLRKARKSLMQTPRKSKKSLAATATQSGPTDRELLELRAEGRAVLTDPMRPPSFIVQFCEPPRRDEQGNVQPAVVECESRKATVGGKCVEREPGETQQQFISRVRGMLPASGLPVMAIIWPAEPDKNCIIT